MQTLLQDLRYGARMLLRQPGFTLTVLLTLALGIGANTAIFSVVNAVMLRQLPFTDADRLVRLYERNLERGWPDFGVSHPNFLDWRAQSRSFAGMGALTGASFNLNTGGEVEVIRGVRITADLLTVLGVQPALGRNFLPEEDRPGGNTRVALLTHSFWQRRLGGDPGVVGKTLTINDESFSVVGVLPESFRWYSGPSEIFAPLAPDSARSRSDHRLRVVGRLKPGVTSEQALAEMNIITRQLAQQYPQSNQGWSVGGQSFYDWVVPEESRRSLLVFVGAVIFVLLIACSNVANLLLARATARQKEIAIRVALGAPARRIVRQLLTEALLLALVAGGLGLFVTFATVSALKTMNPGNLPRLDELSVDGSVLAFSLLVSLLTGVLFGLFPALQAARPDLNETLKEGGLGIAGDVRSFGLDAEPGAMIYIPAATAAFWTPMHLAIRTGAEPVAQTAAVRGFLRSLDANVPVYDIQPAEQLLYDSLGSRRFNLFLLGSFAGIALLLASVGLFGVMAYLVSQRTREIGVRLALGARPGAVFRLVIGRGMLLALIGATVGLVSAFGLARFLETLLFQVKPTDALAFTLAPLLLLGVALPACYVPARRAMKVDPMVALRCE